jgi:hypothetical protein
MSIISLTCYITSNTSKPGVKLLFRGRVFQISIKINMLGMSISGILNNAIKNLPEDDSLLSKHVANAILKALCYR